MHAARRKRIAQIEIQFFSRIPIFSELPEAVAWTTPFERIFKDILYTD